MPKDYSRSGLTLQAAFVAAKKLGELPQGGPAAIVWNGDVVQNSDHIKVPKHGWVTLTILADKYESVRQGVDIEAENGWLELKDGKRVNLLRTWSDHALEDTVTYKYYSKSGRIIVWNVYRMEYAGGQTVEERWTENAGMKVTVVDARKRCYKASPGFASPPDFEGLEFEVQVAETA